MSAARSVVFPFANSISSAGDTTRIDTKLERRLCCEVVGAMAGREFDEAVVSLYSSRPKIVEPREQDLRRNQLRFSR